MALGGRKDMRPVALATAPILALLLLGNAAAESRDETSARCADHSARPDLAIAACTALIEGAWGLTGHLVDDYVNRGIAYAMKRQCDQAIQDYDRAIELDHRDAVTFVNRAGAYVRQGDYDRAVQDYDQPIRLDPTNAAAFDNRGIDYGRKGEYDRAIQDFDQAGSTPALRPPSTIAALLTAARANIIGRFRISTRPSGSIPVTPSPTTTAAISTTA